MHPATLVLAWMLALTSSLALLAGCSQVMIGTSPGLPGTYTGELGGSTIRVELRSEEVYTWGWGEVGSRSFALAVLGPWRGPAVIAFSDGELGAGDLGFSGAGVDLTLPGTAGAAALERSDDGTGSTAGGWTGRWTARGGVFDLRLEQSSQGIAGHGNAGDQAAVIACPAPTAGSTRCSLLFPDGGSLRLGVEERGRALVVTGLGAPLELHRRGW
ncbi:MAG: hypothetical protein KDD11_07775 [Acidobacteria bacterium]|nr:hypothetical protein [Acidobacteriota bacterium]